MATDPRPAHTARAQAHRCTDERWQRMWSQREQLLKVARRRSVSLEDAEDAVHEAMLRAMEHPDLDDERLGAWLTTVTVRLCVDRHRQVRRETEVGSSTVLSAPPSAPLEDVVCDRAEARWLAGRSGELPGRQAEALWLKSDDLDVGQVATHMGLSYRTVESLLARARHTLRNALAGTLGLVLWLCGRRPGTGGAPAGAVVSTAATLAVLGIAVPGVYDSTPPDTPRVAPERDRDWPAMAYDELGGAGTGTVPGQRSAPPVLAAEDLNALLTQSSLPALDALPALGVSSPSAAPRVSLPRLDTVPQIPGVPDAAERRLPDAPEVPEVPATTAEPEVPAPSGTPEAPELPLPTEPDLLLDDPVSGSPSDTASAPDTPTE